MVQRRMKSNQTTVQRICRLFLLSPVLAIGNPPPFFEIHRTAVNPPAGKPAFIPEYVVGGHHE